MKKSDINSMSDIFQRMLTEAASGGMDAAQSSGGDPYSYGPENLRENKYIDKGGKVLVRFFTKKPASENENDVLHNADGPAVIFGEGGQGDEFFFLNGERIDMSNPAEAKKYRAAGAEISYRGQEKEITGKSDFGDLGAFN